MTEPGVFVVPDIIRPRYSFHEYATERVAAQGVPFENPNEQLCLGALGLAGEAGEVVELVKKHCYHGKPIDPAKLLLELGDVLWYVMYTAHAAGFTLEEVAQANNEKLRKRYPNGFSVEAASKTTGDAT